MFGDDFKAPGDIGKRILARRAAPFPLAVDDDRMSATAHVHYGRVVAVALGAYDVGLADYPRERSAGFVSGQFSSNFGHLDVSGSKVALS
jgi:hypothetical protein